MIELEPIGVVRSPLEEPHEAPSQGLKDDIEGTIEIEQSYADGLKGLSVGQELIVVWYADQADRDLLELDKVPGRGVFNSRSPARPNPIVITPCRIEEIRATSVKVSGIDMIDGSPVLDLKVTLERDLEKP
ncbi:MAG: tRNA (N6-threonylcarbamoyladenosine(37)-N6)-methyltransferase TrmO [Halodesulfurarchaeum sp.]